MKRTKIGYRLSVRQDGDWRRFTMEIREFSTRDASAELAHHVGTGNEQYYLNRLRDIKTATNGGSKFLEEDYAAENVEIIWQGNGTLDYPTGEFYAPRVETRFSAQTLRLLSRISRAAEKSGYGLRDANPAQVLSAIRGLGAVRVEYLSSCYGVWASAEDAEPDDGARALNLDVVSVH